MYDDAEMKFKYCEYKFLLYPQTLYVEYLKMYLRKTIRQFFVYQLIKKNLFQQLFSNNYLKSSRMQIFKYKIQKCKINLG